MITVYKIYDRETGQYSKRAFYYSIGSARGAIKHLVNQAMWRKYRGMPFASWPTGEEKEIEVKKYILKHFDIHEFEVKYTKTVFPLTKGK